MRKSAIEAIPELRNRKSRTVWWARDIVPLDLSKSTRFPQILQSLDRFSLIEGAFQDFWSVVIVIASSISLIVIGLLAQAIHWNAFLACSTCLSPPRESLFKVRE